MNARFQQVDVFTSRPFEGNQLAVFENGDDVPEALKGVIAREMNFPETVYLISGAADGCDAKARIFTPEEELPMAGHPTIGTTFVLAALGQIRAPQPRLMLELKVGPTAVDLEWDAAGTLTFAWMTQKLPEYGPALPDHLRADLARAVNVDESDLLPLPMHTASSGVPFFYIPLESDEAVDRASGDRAGLARVFERAGEDRPRPVFLFAKSSKPGVTFYSRMFAPEFGIAEDPATGGASGPLGAYALKYGLVTADEARAIVSLQGAKMKRPSWISIALDTRDGQLERVRVGGHAVIVGRGDISLPA